MFFKIIAFICTDTFMPVTNFLMVNPAIEFSKIQWQLTVSSRPRLCPQDYQVVLASVMYVMVSIQNTYVCIAPENISKYTCSAPGHT